MPVAIGADAPDFSLVDATDWKKNVKLSELKGSKVVLAFFPNAFSGAPDDGCEMQLCSLKPLAAEGVKVFGISHDWAFQQKAFHAKIELNYPLLCDPSRATIEEFVGTFDKGAFFDKLGLFTPDPKRAPMPAGNRGMVVIDEQGKIAHVEVNPDGPGPVSTAKVKAALA